LEFNVPFQHKYGYIRDEGSYVNLLHMIKAKKYMNLQKQLMHRQNWVIKTCKDVLVSWGVQRIWFWLKDRQRYSTSVLKFY